ncbi:MAG TPA: hypothetical protein VFE46_00885 [Pirellulales bacterium]|jgi:hypothetical protein|nr:hypothetical protein [Pirellulales bacterium]
MRKLFTCLGVVFGVIIIAIILAFAVFLPRAFKLSGEATAYLETEVPKIVEHWNSQELIDAATPELISAAKSSDGIERLFTMFRQLGALKHLDKPHGEIIVNTSTNHGSETTGNYTIPADFEKGSATIHVQLLRNGGGWKINGFHIDSEAFLPPKNEQ